MKVILFTLLLLLVQNIGFASTTYTCPNTVTLKPNRPSSFSGNVKNLTLNFKEAQHGKRFSCLYSFPGINHLYTPKSKKVQCPHPSLYTISYINGSGLENVPSGLNGYDGQLSFHKRKKMSVGFRKKRINKELCLYRLPNVNPIYLDENTVYSISYLRSSEEHSKCVIKGRSGICD